MYAARNKEIQGASLLSQNVPFFSWGFLFTGRMSEGHIPIRRWFRWSLRTMFVVTMVFGCVFAWLVYHISWIRQRREAIELGIAVPHTFAANQMIPEPPLTLRLLGEDGVRHIFVAPSNFERICKLFPESEVMEWPVHRNSRQRGLTLGGSRRISKEPVSPVRPRTPES
jgi:hypothetical protein